MLPAALLCLRGRRGCWHCSVSAAQALHARKRLPRQAHQRGLPASSPMASAARSACSAAAATLLCRLPHAAAQTFPPEHHPTASRLLATTSPYLPPPLPHLEGPLPTLGCMPTEVVLTSTSPPTAPPATSSRLAACRRSAAQHSTAHEVQRNKAAAWHTCRAGHAGSQPGGSDASGNSRRGRQPAMLD